ncbi:IS200/IS605 family transposase, partial [bacterium]|nr:IS200/IS605 family transposase [bacterium]
KALLSEEITKKIKQTTEESEQRYDLEMEQLGCDLDHVHLLCSFHPKYSGGQIVRLFKSITARELFKTFPKLKQELWGGEFWSDGYYLATVGERGNWKTVEQYVQSQGKKPEDMQLRLL